MNICAISDMHGNYNFEVREADILCICGDIIPLEIQRDQTASFEWLQNFFIPWCLKQPVKHTFFIAGNHDWFLQWMDSSVIKKQCEELGEGRVTYLIDEAVTYHCERDDKDYKIYGSPWCHQFFNWAFMTSDEKMEEIFQNIPEDIDILLTHDAPYGRTDLLLQNLSYTKRGHIGNKPLLKRVEEVKPKYHFTGHLHSCNHVPTDYDGTTTACVSMLDENYRCTYKPLIINI